MEELKNIGDYYGPSIYFYAGTNIRYCCTCMVPMITANETPLTDHINWHIREGHRIKVRIK